MRISFAIEWLEPIDVDGSRVGVQSRCHEFFRSLSVCRQSFGMVEIVFQFDHERCHGRFTLVTIDSFVKMTRDVVDVMADDDAHPGRTGFNDAEIPVRIGRRQHENI